MHRPILVMTFPRSGSSMVSGIFAAHGVWAGTCLRGNTANPKGYFENIHIKDMMKMWFGSLIQHNRLAEPKDGWGRAVEYEIRKDGYLHGPWLVKTSPLYYPVWEEMNPYWVNIRRPKEQIIESCLKTRMVNRTRDDLSDFIDYHNRLMDRFGVDVFTPDLIDGDYSSLEQAFDYCEIEFDPAIADGFIEREHWHYP